MRKAILASMLLSVAVVAFGQHGKSQVGGKTASTSKAKPKPKSTPNLKGTDKSWVSPCGVYYKNDQDMFDSFVNEWRLVSASYDGSNAFYYNSGTSEETCTDAGVLKTWIKKLEIKTKAYSFVRYELKCQSSRFRIASATEYDKDGKLLFSDSFDENPWDDAVPETVAAAILKTVCRRP
jgi:hypothetical protein